MQKLIALLLALLFSCPFAEAVAVGSAQQVQISGQVSIGLNNAYPNNIFQYQSTGTTTAYFGGSTIVSVPHNTTNNSYSVATLFPGWTTPKALIIQDVTYPGVNLDVGLSSGGPRFAMASQGFIMVRLRSGTNTIYIDNGTASDALVMIGGVSD